MNEKVLIVEDDLFSAALADRLLTRQGFDTLIAENGAVALNLLLDNPDVKTCLLDMQMPVMDGYSFLQRVTENDSLSNLKIYITGGDTKDQFIRQLIQKPMNLEQVKGYFEKPFHLPEVAAMLKTVAIV